MGMICSFTTISDESIELVRKHPLLIMKWFCSEEEFEAFVEHEQSQRRGIFAKLFGKKPTPLPDYYPCGNENIQYDIDKAWHAIHFLLTGSVWEGEQPLNFIIGGGEVINGCDVGYGPARVFTSAQVKQIDKALQKISKEEFLSRYDCRKLAEAEIYPTIWDKEDDDALEYVIENFLEVKEGIHRMTEQNMGMILGLS